MRILFLLLITNNTFATIIEFYDADILASFEDHDVFLDIINLMFKLRV